jgi:hypothetical protein
MKTITFVAGLRMRGMTAPFMLEGAMNGFFKRIKSATNYKM